MAEEEQEVTDEEQESSSSSSNSSTESNIEAVERWRIPRFPVPGYEPKEDDEPEAKRQRTESLEPFPIRLQRILPHTKILNSEQDYGNYYTKTLDLIHTDAHSCKAIPENPRDELMVTRVREKLPLLVFDTPQSEYFRLYRELLILGRILPPHPHIVRLTDLLVSKRKIFIVSEYCDWPYLDDFFLFARNTAAQRIFKQLVEVVQVMHRHGVVHNRIEPRSVRYESMKFRDIKVINFAKACYNPQMVFHIHDDFNRDHWLEQEEMRFVTTEMANPIYDIIALGRILLAMFTGAWSGDTRTATLRSKRFDQEAHDLLMMLGPRPFPPPQVALTLDDILSHPWMINEPKKP